MSQSAWRDYHLSDPLVEDMLCLEASAGTGKTYTIEGMVARLIAQDGVLIDRLLVVTFTVAATAELKTRIRKVLHQLREALERGTAEDEDHLIVGILLGELGDDGEARVALERVRRAIEGFDEAQIATIHGFCQRALKENAFESGAPFGTELQTSNKPLFLEIAYDGWTRGRHDADRRLLSYLDSHGLSPKALVKIVKEISADPEMPRVPKQGPLSADTKETLDRFDLALARLRERWPQKIDGVVTTLIEASEAGELNKRSYGAKPTQSKREKLESWLSSRSPKAWRAAEVEGFASHKLDGARLSALKKSGQIVRHGLSEEVDALWGACVEASEALDSLATHFILDFADFAEEALRERKKRERILSFDDLLKTLRARVSGPQANPELITALQARYDVALIDEFQDTDPVQWEIFEAVFTGPGRRMIVVGDPKQAIYAFRGADIQTYLSARNHPLMQVAQLGKNHRSDKRVVDGISHLFSASKGGDPFLNPQIQYTKVSAHHTRPRFSAPSGPQAGVVLSMLRREAGGLKDLEVYKTWNWSLPHQITAAQISELLMSDATIIEEGKHRRVRPSDIAVLVRANRHAEEVQEALRQLGVPSTLRHNSTVIQSDEARELIDVLEAVLTPRRSGLVKKALLSRLLGQDLTTLAELETDEVRWTTWTETLAEWRRDWVDKGFATFARQLTTRPLPRPGEAAPMSMTERLLSWRDGERRITNLNHLIELLHEVSLKDKLAPQALIEWLKRERSSEDPEDPVERRQLRLESDGDAVTIVTVHKAKGLEYGIVWCPYLWSKSTTSSNKRLPLRYRDPEDEERWTLDLGVDLFSESKKANVSLADATNLSEATRQLYVALTRAKYQVHILCGPIGGLGKSGLGHLLYPGEEKPETKSDAVLLEALKSLEATSEGTLEVVDMLRLPQGKRLVREVSGPKEPRAKRFSRSSPIDTWWRRTSFSGLTHNTRSDERPVQDHDAEPEAEADVQLESEGVSALDPGHDDTREVSLKDFRGGTRAGTCIHEIYEEHDFQSPEALKALVRQKLEAYRFDARQWTDVLSASIQSSLETPLGLSPQLTLSEISRAQRFDELDFVFPLRPAGESALRASQIGALMRLHPGPGLPKGYAEMLEALNFLPVRGFMVGSIDLIFEHAGRWYVVDYKSNNLGQEASDYTSSHLAEAMSHSHYVLQYHIYTLALHRYLSYRLGERYRFEEHFGGVLYLFMRGMSPDYAPQTGVFFDRPPQALVEGLSALMEGER